MSNENTNHAELSSPGDQVPNTISYRPRGRSINIAGSGATALDSLRDMLDNVVDALKRRAREGRDLPDEVTAIFEYDSVDGMITIKDNAYGGLEPERLGEIPAMGASSNLEEGIGHFGIGGIRPSVLGNTIKYGSHRLGEPPSEFVVDVDELRADDTGDEEVFESPRREADDIDSGWTRIQIEDLKNGIEGLIRSSIEEIGMDTDADNLYDEHGLDPIARALGRTYARLIEKGISTVSGTVPFSIELRADHNKTFVEPADDPSLLPLPVDGLTAREYRNVPFSEQDDIENPTPEVRANVKVGLKPKADMQTAGLYLAIQDRMILYADTSSRLFTSQYLGNLRDSAGHGRLVIKVELEEVTSGQDDDRTYLPINSMKNGLDYNSPIAPHLLSFIGNAASPYKAQGYDAMPDWLVKAYAPENLDIEAREALSSANIDEITVDKTDAKTNAARAKPKAGKWVNRSRSYPERDTLRKIVETHSFHRIRVSDPISYLGSEMKAVTPKADAFAIAYDYYMNHEFTEAIGKFTGAKPMPATVDTGPSIDWDTLPRLLKDPQHDRDGTIPQSINYIVNIAGKHAEDGTRADTTDHLKEWEIPRYQEELHRETGGSLDSLQPLPSDESVAQSDTAQDSVAQSDSSREMSEERPFSSTKNLAKEPSDKQKTIEQSKLAEPADDAAQTVKWTEDQMEAMVEVPKRGLAIALDGDLYVADEDTLDRLFDEYLDGDAEDPEEILESLFESLDRKKKLEQAAAIFQSVD